MDDGVSTGPAMTTNTMDGGETNFDYFVSLLEGICTAICHQRRAESCHVRYNKQPLRRRFNTKNFSLHEVDSGGHFLELFDCDCRNEDTSLRLLSLVKPLTRLRGIARVQFKSNSEVTGTR